MRSQRLDAPRAKAVDPLVGPYIAAIAPMAAEFDVIAVWTIADPKHTNQFVLRTVKASLACVGFRPDAQVQHSPIDAMASLDQFSDMPPIHADIVDGALYRKFHCNTERRLKEDDKLGYRHFAGSTGEFGVLDPPAPANVANPQIVRGISEDRRRSFASHHPRDIDR